MGRKNVENGKKKVENGKKKVEIGRKKRQAEKCGNGQKNLKKMF